MKILVCGEGRHYIYEQAFADAFTNLGHTVKLFKWQHFFPRGPFGSIEAKLCDGIFTRRFNAALIRCNIDFKADFVFIYRGTHIMAKTAAALKKSGSIIFSYNNDNPFSDHWTPCYWRHYRQSLNYCDWNYVYRARNAHDLRRMKVTNCSVLLPYYIKCRNFPIKHLADNQYTCDVCFIGHYEDDGRDDHIKAIIERGYHFKLFGTGWNLSRHARFFRDAIGPVKAVTSEYNVAINSAKIALAFFSRRNNDTYTRRCFEIPAAKTFMLSQYSEDISALFSEDKEAAYFRSKQDMLNKLEFHLAHDSRRKRIAAAGHTRLLANKHEVTDRAKTIIEKYKKLSASINNRKAIDV